MPNSKFVPDSSQFTLSIDPLPSVRRMGPSSLSMLSSKESKASDTEPHSRPLPAHHRRPSSSSTAEGKPRRSDQSPSRQSAVNSIAPKSTRTDADISVDEV